MGKYAYPTRLAAGGGEENLARLTPLRQQYLEK